MMGCSTSKAATTAAMRMLEYEQLASSEDSGLKLVPSSLDTEEWRDGLIRHTAASRASLDIYLHNYEKFNPKEIDTFIMLMRCLTYIMIDSVHKLVFEATKVTRYIRYLYLHYFTLLIIYPIKIFKVKLRISRYYENGVKGR